MDVYHVYREGVDFIYYDLFNVTFELMGFRTNGLLSFWDFGFLGFQKNGQSPFIITMVASINLKI